VQLDYYGNMITDKQREAMECYYNEDYSLSEISEHLDITRQGVRDNIKRGEAYLLELEEKLEFKEKFQTLTTLTEKISEAADEIRRVNLENGAIGQIDRLAKDISDLADKVSKV
jgi:predicted DNA-binding protein YlxM (UPF0122 family)